MNRGLISVRLNWIVRNPYLIVDWLFLRVAATLRIYIPGQRNRLAIGLQLRCHPKSMVRSTFLMVQSSGPCTLKGRLPQCLLTMWAKA